MKMLTAALFSFGLNGGGLDEEGVCNFVECHGEEICDLAQQLQQGQNCALADGEIHLCEAVYGDAGAAPHRQCVPAGQGAG